MAVSDAGRVTQPHRLLSLPERLLERKRSSGRLGSLLAWSVVFADIGTSIYYVPGILYGDGQHGVGAAAAAFVLATGLAVILLALKYVDVSARYPDGGGVVSVATDAFGPMAGCLGGSLICASYFLTAAISSVSSFIYISGVLPLGELVTPAACVALVFLGVLNVIGIRESAVLTAVLAAASLAVNLILLVIVGSQLDAQTWQLVLGQMRGVGSIGPWRVMVGFAGAWLAFSGLESISQISPALREPREKTAFRAMMLVVVTLLLTSPLTTAMCTALLEPELRQRYMFELGSRYGGAPMRMAVVLTAATLLVGAANTAIIGCYHVFISLGRLGFLPRRLGERNARFGTPHRAIVVSVLIPVGIALATHGNVDLLGHMYTFGLLGAFTFTSVGLDRIRWQERRRGLGFWGGTVISVLIAAAWGITIVSNHQATLFGGGVTLFGFLLATAIRRGWIGKGAQGFTSADEAEAAAAKLDAALEVVTVEEAIEMRAIYKSTTLIAIRAPNLRLFQEALARARGAGDTAVYVLYVDEIPGLFFPPKSQPSRDAIEVLTVAVDYFRQADFLAIPIWRMAHDSGASIAGAAHRLAVDAVMVGTSQRNAVWHLLRGNVLRSLVRDLPGAVRVWICN
jgi:amino acid transporter